MDPNQDSTCYLVYITTDSEATADALAAALVQERLAACVNRIGPIRSTYVWQGELQQESEYLLMVKTQQQRLPALQQRVQELHSYEVPEIIAVPIAEGLPAYLHWIVSQTQESTP